MNINDIKIPVALADGEAMLGVGDIVWKVRTVKSTNICCCCDSQYETCTYIPTQVEFVSRERNTDELKKDWITLKNESRTEYAYAHQLYISGRACRAECDRLNEEVQNG